MSETQVAVEGLSKLANSPFSQKNYTKTSSFHKKQRKGFSVAEAMIALLIGSIALGMAAPMITKQVKQSNFTDTQLRIVNNQNNDLREIIDDLRERIENLENAESSGIPVGTVAFFNLESCPDNTWQNVTELGWGGQFFRVADELNPRNMAQEQSIQEHWHNLPNFKLYDKRAGWTGGHGMFALNGEYVRSYAYAGAVYRVNHGFSGSPLVSAVNETRPKNVPLTTCVKIK